MFYEMNISRLCISKLPVRQVICSPLGQGLFYISKLPVRQVMGIELGKKIISVSKLPVRQVMPPPTVY